MQAAITVDNVSHAYRSPDSGTVATLNNVSLEVRKGELLCLIGPSGCGKSTLLNIIGGLVAPSAGEVRVNGNPINGPSPHEIAYVFQDNTLFPWNTILDNIKVGARIPGRAGERAAEPRGRSDRGRRPQRFRQELSAPAFRRHEAARLAGARAVSARPTFC